MAPRLKEKYDNEIAAQLKEDLGLENAMQVPRLLKIVVNMGVGDAAQDAKLMDAAVEDLRIITGQQPKVMLARKSISNFKLREGVPVGASTTLRGARMWEFLDRLLSVSLPRVRDFKGLSPKAFDGRGNYSLGLREQLAFPEIDRGLGISSGRLRHWCLVSCRRGLYSWQRYICVLWPVAGHQPHGNQGQYNYGADNDARVSAFAVGRCLLVVISFIQYILPVGALSLAE